MQPVLQRCTDTIRPAVADTAELGRTLAGTFITARSHSKNNKRQCRVASTVIERPAAPSVTEQKDRSNGADTPGKARLLLHPVQKLLLLSKGPDNLRLLV